MNWLEEFLKLRDEVERQIRENGEADPELLERYDTLLARKGRGDYLEDIDDA